MKLKTAAFVILIPTLLSCISQRTTAQADEGSSLVPNALLKIATREKEDGTITRVIDVFILEWGQGDCSLTTLVFNRCMRRWDETVPDSFFSPTIWRSSTTDGTLKVRNLGDQLEVSENVSGPVVTTQGRYLFGYSFGSRTSNFANKVTSFSGAATISIPYLKKVYTGEFVPFVGGDVWVQLDCNSVWLQGIDTTK